MQVSQTLEGNSGTWGDWGLESLAADNTGGQGLKEQMVACRVVALGCLATGASSALILYKDTHKKWLARVSRLLSWAPGAALGEVYAAVEGGRRGVGHSEPRVPGTSSLPHRCRCRCWGRGLLLAAFPAPPPGRLRLRREGGMRSLHKLMGTRSIRQ